MPRAEQNALSPPRLLLGEQLAANTPNLSQDGEQNSERVHEDMMLPRTEPKTHGLR